jgi:hypothetical protein
MTLTVEADPFMDGFLVFLVVLMTALTLAGIAVEVLAVRAWTHEVKFAQLQLSKDPTFDPLLQEHIIPASELKLGKLLGAGMEGQVFQSVYLGADVAVKVALLSRSSTVPIAEQIQGAETEAQTMLKLSHPHIVRFFGVAIISTSMEVEVLTVLELCTGSVDDLIKKNAMSSAASEGTSAGVLRNLKLCRQMAQGMAYLHSKGVIHRGEDFVLHTQPRLRLNVCFVHSLLPLM